MIKMLLKLIGRQESTSIKTKLSLWFSVSTLLVILISIFPSHFLSQRTLKMEKRLRLASIADDKKHILENWLKERISDTNIIANTILVRKKLGKIIKSIRDDNYAEYQNEYDDLLDYLDAFVQGGETLNYDEIFIIEPNSGRILISTDPITIGEDRKDSSVFQEALKSNRIYIKDIYYSENSSKTMMALSKAIPLVDLKTGEPTGKTAGVLVCLISVDNILGSFLQDRTGLGDTGEIILVNRDEIPLMKSAYSQIAVFQKFSHPDISIKLAAEGKQGIIDTVDYRNVPVIAAYRHINIPLVGWGLVVKQDIQDIFKDVNRIELIAVIFTVFLLGLVTVLTNLFSRRISQPIVEVSKAAEQIAKGGLTRSLPVKTKDEIGVLATSFNLMVQSLRDRDEKLHLRAEELKSAYQKSMEATQLKSRFLANMSHELRTPMNAIIGFTTLVLRKTKDVLPVKQYENLEKVKISANNLLSLINDILDLSKIEAGKMTISMQSCDIINLMEESLHSIEPQAKEKSLSLVKRYRNKPLFVNTDPNRVKQVLVNLLGNAVKFTKEGSITIALRTLEFPGAFSEAARNDATVNILLMDGPVKRQKFLEISVIDTGIGIPPDHLDAIFEEFRQVDSSTTRIYGGTGLGLTITKKLCVLLGGDIYVQSKLGEGSAFSLTLPLQSEEENK
ncbi:MAG: ATP-binding protein [Elusimicrobiota bacterium]